MKKTKKAILRFLSLTLAILFLFAFAACSKPGSDGENTTPQATDGDQKNGADESSPAAPDSSLEMKIYALNGTTALGMAQMMDSVSKGTASMNYNISLHTSADSITGSIIQGECAIAALPTNVAVKLYHRSTGKLKLLAVNTLGVLYLLQGEGENVTSLNDLRGKTVYLPGAGSNPEYITAALMNAAGLKVGKDVTLDTTSYPSPDALQTAMASGTVKLAVLPEPKVTVVTSGNSSVRVSMDLTEEWEKLNGKNTLVQGCLVVNTAFAEAHPAEVAQFLKDYEASVNFIKEGSDEAVSMIVSAGILPKASIAKKALPKCNLCYLAGQDMKAAMNSFCEKIFAYDKNSIAQMPDDGFYYVAK